VANPGLDQAITVTNHTEHEDESSASFYLLGMQFPIIVSDVMRGTDGQLEITVADTNKLQAILQLLRSRDVLLFTSPLGESKYVRLGPVKNNSGSSSGMTGGFDAKKTLSDQRRPVTVLTVNYVEVAAPVDPGQTQ